FAKIVGLLILMFLVIPILLSGYVPYMQAYTRLLLGWLTFLPERLPRATVNWSGVGMLVLCLALTISVGHNFCGSLWRGSGNEGSWRPRWTLAGVAVIVLLFVSGMAVTGV